MDLYGVAALVSIKRGNTHSTSTFLSPAVVLRHLALMLALSCAYLGLLTEFGSGGDVVILMS